jgi:hypothetical protein
MLSLLILPIVRKDRFLKCFKAFLQLLINEQAVQEYDANSFIRIANASEEYLILKERSVAVLFKCPACHFLFPKKESNQRKFRKGQQPVPFIVPGGKQRMSLN